MARKQIAEWIADANGSKIACSGAFSTSLPTKYISAGPAGAPLPATRRPLNYNLMENRSIIYLPHSRLLSGLITTFDPRQILRILRSVN